MILPTWECLFRRIVYVVPFYTFDGWQSWEHWSCKKEACVGRLHKINAEFAEFLSLQAQRLMWGHIPASLLFIWPQNADIRVWFVPFWIIIAVQAFMPARPALTPLNRPAPMTSRWTSTPGRLWKTLQRCTWLLIPDMSILSNCFYLSTRYVFRAIWNEISTQAY